MFKSGVYKILNIINSKVYIGSSENIPKRWKRHLKGLKNNKHGNKYLQRAFNIYGEDNFKFEVIETCSKEKTFLLKREQFYINLYKSSNPKFGYNLSPTAGSNLGYKHTNEAKQNMRLANAGKNKGRKCTEETKQKISLANIDKPKSEETKQLISEALTGYKHTDEACLNMSLAHIGVPWSKARREAIRVPLSDKAKQNISKALKGKPSGRKGKKYPKSCKLEKEK
jgi:group I intron endonuclease